MRAPAAQRLLAKVVRAELGIDALRALSWETRGPVPFGLEPRRARPSHAWPSAELPLPDGSGVPRTARRLTAAYGSRETTPLAVAQRALEHAATFGLRAPLHARNDERTFADARASTERYERRAPLGELDGVPFVVKEELNVAGYATRLGTSFMPDMPASEDAVFVARLRRAGAIVLGQTPMTEYGLSPLGANAHRRMPRNAHDETRLAGGSSTGSAVAVALGVVPFGVGTDGGGSVRVPAAYNGVFGFKPTYGRIPCTGHGMYGGTSVVHFGVIAASTTELALTLELGAGADAGDPPSLAGPPLAAGELERALRRGARGLRLGVPASEWARADADVARAGEAALRALERAGAMLVPVELPLARHAAAMGYLTVAIEAGAALREVAALKGRELGHDLQVFLAGVHGFASDDYVVAQRLREALRGEVERALRSVDLIALPTTVNVAPAVTDAEAASGLLDTGALDAACRFAFLGNLLGLPACSVPVGTGAHALPVGLQLVGDAWDEASVLAAAAELERLGVAGALRAPGALDLLA